MADNVTGNGADPTAVVATPAAPAPVPVEAKAADAPAPAPVAAEPKAEPKSESKSTPSLLAAADPGKRDGASEVPAAEVKKSAQPAEPKPSQDGATDPAKKGEPAKGEVKPAEAKAEAEAKPDGAEPTPEKKDALAQEPPAPPTFAALKLPENVKVDEAVMAKVDTVFGKLETTSKADHALVEAVRQELADYHIAEIQRVANDIAKHQVDVWNRLREQRVNELKSDPQLGGNRIETTLGNAKYALESMFGLSKTEVSELIAVADAGGVSDHRLFVKLLHNAFEKYGEPHPVPSNPMPMAPKGRERGQRGWYENVDGASQA